MSVANNRDKERPLRLLAIASGGGHWTQLLRLRPSFEGCAVTYASTIADHADVVEDSATYYVVREASRWSKFGIVRSAISVAVLLVRVRPDVVISTGALPGFFAIVIGKIVLRARTIWVDSIANADELSLSGRRVERFADLWLTQWDHLAGEDGPTYSGSVIG